MREHVKIVFYANKSGAVGDKGYLPAQLGCASMVKVWVESNIIEKYNLSKHVDVSVHYIEGRGYIVELNHVDWTFGVAGSPIHEFKTSTLEFVEAFNLKDSNTLSPCDYALEIATVNRNGRQFTLHQWGNHNYAIDVKHTIDLSPHITKPLSIDDSDWFGERK